MKNNIDKISRLYLALAPEIIWFWYNAM